MEDQSVDTLEHIAEHIIVIGGWAVRAWARPPRGLMRYTIDIDGVAEESKMGQVESILQEQHLRREQAEWGLRFRKDYVPQSQEAKGFMKTWKDPLEVRVEISPTRMYEADGEHFFEFEPHETIRREIRSRGSRQPLSVKVPTSQYLMANKVGLGADYKNRYDAAILALQADLEQVASIIVSTDKWKDIVIRQLPRFLGRTRQPTDLAATLLEENGYRTSSCLKGLAQLKKLLEEGDLPQAS
ncbi:MAG: hypothetical protein ACE5IB_06600 [Candidatus Geothermarchaeales archaeon]